MFPHANFPKCSVINYIRKTTSVFRCSAHSMALYNSLSLVVYLKWLSELSLLSNCNFLETLIDKKKIIVEQLEIKKCHLTQSFFVQPEWSQKNVLSNFSGMKTEVKKGHFLEYFTYCKHKPTFKMLSMFLSFSIHNIS